MAIGEERAFEVVGKHANLVLEFTDQSTGRVWMAAAVMTPLKAVDGQDFFSVKEMPDRPFLLTNLKVVTE